MFDGLEVDLGKVFVHHKPVETVYQHIDARRFGSRLPEVASPVVPLSQWHVACGVGRGPCSRRVRVRAMVPAYGQATLHNQFVLVVLLVMVVARVGVAHRGEHSQVAVYLVVGVEARLQGEQAVGALLRALLKRLDVGVADVAAQRPPVVQPEILSQAIIEGAREVAVEAHVGRSHTNDVVGGSVAESQRHVGCRVAAAKRHHVDDRRRVYVLQSDLFGARVVCVVHQSHLHAVGMFERHIDESHLRSCERVGVVVAAHLQSAHASRRHIGQQAHLRAAANAHGDVRP